MECTGISTTEVHVLVLKHRALFHILAIKDRFSKTEMNEKIATLKDKVKLFKFNQTCMERVENKNKVVDVEENTPNHTTLKVDLMK